MEKKRRFVYIDIIFCVIVMPLIIMLLPVDQWLENRPIFLFFILIYAYLLFFVYRRINIPSLLLRKEFGMAVLTISIILAVNFLVVALFDLENSDFDESKLMMRNVIARQAIWFFFFVVTGFSMAIDITSELFRQIVAKQELENQKDRTELALSKAQLALYKAQINPHFLFNTLNTLYSLMLIKSDKAEKAFMEFTNILRYMYTQDLSGKSSIATELEYIRQYIELQKLRLSEHTTVEFLLDIQDDTLQIPPMILLTFVENAFKYGTSPDDGSLLCIKAKSDSSQFIFTVQNPIFDITEQKGDGYGVENCRKRLALLFPDKHSLDISAKDGIFRVELKIDMQ